MNLFTATDNAKEPFVQICLLAKESARICGSASENIYGKQMRLGCQLPYFCVGGHFESVICGKQMERSKRIANSDGLKYLGIKDGSEKGRGKGVAPATISPIPSKGIDG